MTLGCVLIANRGEIACRILRTAQRLRMKTIAVFSEADRDALHVRLADEAVCLGPAPARDSYLSIEKIIAAGLDRRADCVHPGYGFLAENADFAQACAEAGLVFIGPSAAAIRAVGDKSAAKALVRKLGLPVLPGYHGARQDADFLAREADRLGYPLLIKACAGGGGKGKGMRLVQAHSDFAEALAGARREAAAAFGDARVLLEKYVTRPRHVEMQIFGDAHGRIAHLFERDCSLQRRHQKIIEEAPAPGMSEETRAAMGEAAVRIAAAVDYVGAGTVEFIVDADRGLRPDAFWFMEMNTRLQVEHAVTEAIAGLDLVELQFRVAAGEPLGFAQSDVRLQGHAIEARLYAEDPAREFLPSAGRLISLRLPEGEGIRVETGLEQGADVSSLYDSLVAKIIAHGASREQALDRLEAALAATCAIGPRCNLALLAALVRAPAFRSGAFDTGSVARLLAAEAAVLIAPDAMAIAACVCDLAEEERMRRCEGSGSDDPWDARDCFQLGPARRTPVEIEADGAPMRAFWSLAGLAYRIETPALGFDAIRPAPIQMTEDRRARAGDVEIFIDGAWRIAWRNLRQTEVRLRDPLEASRRTAEDAEAVVVSPMPGRIARLFVEEGAQVDKGQALVVVEAMKMEHVLRAPRAGEVAALQVREGDQVALGAPLLEIAPKDGGRSA